MTVIPIVTLVAVLAGYVVAGIAGAFVVAAAAAVIALLAVRLRFPPAHPERGTPNRRKARSNLTLFPAYLRLHSAVSWSDSSRRHFEGGTRPHLIDLLSGLLAERHNIDLHRDPERARALIGEDVWALLEPGRLAAPDSPGAGMDRAALTRIVECLEVLGGTNRRRSSE